MLQQQHSVIQTFVTFTLMFLMTSFRHILLKRWKESQGDLSERTLTCSAVAKLMGRSAHVKGACIIQELSEIFST